MAPLFQMDERVQSGYRVECMCQDLIRDLIHMIVSLFPTRPRSLLKSRLAKNSGVDVVIAPPYVYLDAVCRIRNGSNHFMMGAQNVHHEKLGAHTGEISLPMLLGYGVTHVILGHSERRAEGET